jgi:AcrR family transcriptional regulator/DNA-binding MarR family transcriptional regulator
MSGRREPGSTGVTTHARGRGVSSLAAHHQRERLAAAMTVLAAEQGWQNVTVDMVCERAMISKRTFYALFADREDCLVLAVQRSVTWLTDEVASAVAAAGGEWSARVGAALSAFYLNLDADRLRAWLIVIETVSGSDRARDVRRVALEPLARLVDEGRDALLPPTGTAAVGAVVELAYRHLTGPDAEASMLSLIAPAAYLVFAPRLGRRAALAEAERIAGAAVAAPRVDAADHVVEDSALRLTRLMESTLLYLAGHRGARNVEIAAAIGVEHQSQISRHLRRLEDAKAAHRTRDGRSNAWELTALGERLAGELRDAQDRASEGKERSHLTGIETVVSNRHGTWMCLDDASAR